MVCDATRMNAFPTYLMGAFQPSIRSRSSAAMGERAPERAVKKLTSDLTLILRPLKQWLRSYFRSRNALSTTGLPTARYQCQQPLADECTGTLPSSRTGKNNYSVTNQMLHANLHWRFAHEADPGHASINRCNPFPCQVDECRQNAFRPQIGGSQ